VLGIVIVCQSRGTSKASQCRHQTFLPLGSASFSSSLLAGAAPEMANSSAQLSAWGGEHLPRDDEAAAALEVEVEGERRGARGPGARPRTQLGEAGCDRHPAGRVTEVVQDVDSTHAPPV
jgi:hypothetical protein